MSKTDEAGEKLSLGLHRIMGQEYSRLYQNPMSSCSESSPSSVATQTPTCIMSDEFDTSKFSSPLLTSMLFGHIVEKVCFDRCVPQAFGNPNTLTFANASFLTQTATWLHDAITPSACYMTGAFSKP